LLAVRMVAVHPDAELDRWLAAVLQHDGAEARGGAKWRPPKEWNPKGVERGLVQRSLTREADVVAACARVLAAWSGAGIVDRELDQFAVAKWFKAAMEGKLRCPRTDPKKDGAPRQHQAAVRVARLVRGRRADLSAAWEKAYILGPRPPTKQEVINDLTTALEKLAGQHAAKLGELREIMAALTEVARKAGARATKAQQRAWTVRKINRREWREMLNEMRGGRGGRCGGGARRGAAAAARPQEGGARGEARRPRLGGGG